MEIDVVSFVEKTTTDTVEDCTISGLFTELEGPVASIEEDTASETEEDCILSELSIELVSSVVTFEEDTASETVVVCIVSTFVPVVVSRAKGNVSVAEVATDEKGVVTSLDTSEKLVVIVEVPPMGFRLVPVVRSRA